MKSKITNKNKPSKFKKILIATSALVGASALGLGIVATSRKINKNDKESKKYIIERSSTEFLIPGNEDERIDTFSYYPTENDTRESLTLEDSNIKYIFGDLIYKFTNESEENTPLEISIKNAIDSNLNTTGNYQTEFTNLFAKWDEFKIAFNKVYKANVVLLVKNFEELSSISNSIKEVFKLVVPNNSNPQEITSKLEETRSILETFSGVVVSENTGYTTVEKEDWRDTPFIKSLVNQAKLYRLDHQITDSSMEETNNFKSMIDTSAYKFQQLFKGLITFKKAIKENQLENIEKSNQEKLYNFIDNLTKSIINIKASGDSYEILSNFQFNSNVIYNEETDGNIENNMFQFEKQQHDNYVEFNPNNILLDVNSMLHYRDFLLAKKANEILEELKEKINKFRLDDSEKENEIRDYIKKWPNGFISIRRGDVETNKKIAEQNELSEQIKTMKTYLNLLTNQGHNINNGDESSSTETPDNTGRENTETGPVNPETSDNNGNTDSVGKDDSEKDNTVSESPTDSSTSSTPDSAPESDQPKNDKASLANKKSEYVKKLNKLKEKHSNYSFNNEELENAVNTFLDKNSSTTPDNMDNSDIENGLNILNTYLSKYETESVTEKTRTNSDKVTEVTDDSNKPSDNEREESGTGRLSHLVDNDNKPNDEITDNKEEKETNSNESPTDKPINETSINSLDKNKLKTILGFTALGIITLGLAILIAHIIKRKKSKKNKKE